MIFERGHFDASTVNESFINESLKETRMFSASDYSSKPTVFLSHKHDDLKDMRGFMGKLQGLGAKVYIDSMDIECLIKRQVIQQKELKRLLNIVVSLFYWQQIKP